MHPLFSSLTIDKALTIPVYFQLTEKLMNAIKEGLLQPGTQLPGTRQLAEILVIHRKTVIRAYDDLLAQGWLESKTGSGTFVAGHLPVVQPRRIDLSTNAFVTPLANAGYSFDAPLHLERQFIKSTARYHLDDGFPDPRLAPLTELSRACRTQLLTGNAYDRLGYDDPQGSPRLRDELVNHFRDTRGMNVTSSNILITRGTTMGLYLSVTGLIKPADLVVVGAPGWSSAEITFNQAGALVLQVGTDDYGIRTDELEQLCQKYTVRMIYITSHHHYPTTVSLRAERRIHLLKLSVTYGFIIFEDDYDYDFHYLNKPLSPLASADQAGMVLYCGSFTKAISPAFRVGYLVGSANVIAHLAKLRRIIDRQGDTMLDNAVAELLHNGIIQRHLRKSVRVYRERRDIFCKLLESELGNWLNFRLPEGGMAVWTTFDSAVDLVKLSHLAFAKGLCFADGHDYRSPLHQANATRLGFASSTPEELGQCIEILKQLLSKY